jgi:hypothetical protein
MQIRMTALLVVLAASAAALPVAAQDNPKQPAAANPKQPVRAGTPRAVAERVLASLARKDAEAFTRDVHPEAIAAFRANVVRILEQSATPDQRAQGLKFFGGARSLDELKKMPAERVFVAYMRGVFGRMPAAPELRITNAIIGEVLEGDSFAHIVYRSRVASPKESVTNVTVLSLRRSPGGWKAQLDGDLQGLAGPRAPLAR